MLDLDGVVVALVVGHGAGSAFVESNLVVVGDAVADLWQVTPLRKVRPETRV